MNKDLTHCSQYLHKYTLKFLYTYLEKGRSMKNSTRLAVCSISAALSVVLLFLGGITFVLAYAMPMLVSLLMIILNNTFGAKSAWVTYAAVCLLSFILVSDKECTLMYIMFFGYYPIIKCSLDKLKQPFKVLLKFIVFNASLTACQLILVYLFHIPFLEEGEEKYFIIFFAVLMNFLFIIYDGMLEAMAKLYKLKLEKRIKHLFK